MLYQPWIEYEADSGHGWARPDFVLTPNGRERHRVVVDAKRTATWRAEGQLRELYLPLLRVLYPDSEFTLIQVAKYSGGMRTGTLTLRDVLALPPSNEVNFWHWMG